MATAVKKSRDQITRELARSQAVEIKHAEIAKGSRSEHPVSVRLSAPLLEALDRLAQREHRKRGNLIQHILWEYVQAKSK